MVGDGRHDQVRQVAQGKQVETAGLVQRESMTIIWDEGRHVEIEIDLGLGAFAFPYAHEASQDMYDAMGLEIQVADFVADVGRIERICVD